MLYCVNEAGDVYGRQREDGSVEPFDPDSWGWLSRKAALPAHRRRTIDQISGLPGFSVTVAQGPKFDPGPPRRGAQWMKWSDGSAPAAAIQSRGGVDGTLTYFDRLSDALGRVAIRLPGNPQRSPFIAHDFIQGRRIEVVYVAPQVGPGGEGVVYVVDDGDALKIGHTVGPPAKRIARLQTGNPRAIRTVATIEAASSDVEAHLHVALAQWNRQGEWYERGPLLDNVGRAGGWVAYLTSVLPPGEWSITTHGGADR